MVKKIALSLGLAWILSVGTAFTATQENGQPCPPECVTDSMEIITYYPSPYGYYEELRGDKIIVGDTDNSRIDETHLPPSGTLTFEPKSYAEITNTGTSYEGAIYYDSFDHEFKYYDNNSSWQPLGGDGNYWKPSGASGRSNSDIYYDWSGNVGIGVDAGETIGAKLQIETSPNTKGLIIKSALDTSVVDVTIKFDTVGQHSYKVPTGVSSLQIIAYGAQGGDGKNAGTGGLGGKMVGTIAVAYPETIYIHVGGAGKSRLDGRDGGYNGGGKGGHDAGGGGGASDVRQGGNSLVNRVLVAGGGGGGGGSQAPADVYGGAGGGENGAIGSGDGPGGGGTQTKGGIGGSGSGDGDNGTSGTEGIGGAGGLYCYAGGGGGGGYYGGGGGGAAQKSCPSGGVGGGGGGGSSYSIAAYTTFSGVRPGNGEVAIITRGPGANIIEWQNVSNTVTTLGAITAKGEIGIGTAAPIAYLEVANGKSTLADAWSTRSSLRFKENLYPIDNALTKLTSLQGVYFDYKDSHRHSLGLVAEDVGRIFPELVTYEPDGKNAIALDYDKLGAVLVEAVKEQEEKIQKQEGLIQGLEKELKDQKTEIENLKTSLKHSSKE